MVRAEVCTFRETLSDRGNAVRSRGERTPQGRPDSQETIAVAELDGPTAALAAVDRLGDELGGYYAHHATRADLLRRLGRISESRAAYDRAIDLSGNTAETAYLTRRRDKLGP